MGVIQGRLSWMLVPGSPISILSIVSNMWELPSWASRGPSEHGTRTSRGSHVCVTIPHQLSGDAVDRARPRTAPRGVLMQRVYVPFYICATITLKRQVTTTLTCGHCVSVGPMAPTHLQHRSNVFPVPVWQWHDRTTFSSSLSFLVV